MITDNPGFKIEWMTPMAPSCQYCYLLDKMNFRAGVIADHHRPCKPDDFKVDLWTNLFHKDNNEGDWHAVSMAYESTSSVRDDGTIVFLYGVELIITCMGCYDFTFRARHKYEQKYEWGNWIHINGKVEVRRQIDKLTTWTQEPQAERITHNIYIGNYSAALMAPDHGFDCILNLAEEAPVYPQQLSRPVVFKKYSLPFGAGFEISEQTVCGAVNWLRAMSDQCRKVLVSSRDGHGRAGSIMIAFIYAMNPNLTFEEAHKFVDNRYFVYYHKGLRDTLFKLFPRD